MLGDVDILTKTDITPLHPSPLLLLFMNIKYNKKDLKTDLAIGGINGFIFSSIFGFYTASI